MEPNFINEFHKGWTKVVLFQRWTGTWAVAEYDVRRGFNKAFHEFACTGGIYHAHRYFEMLTRKLERRTV